MRSVQVTTLANAIEKSTAQERGRGSLAYGALLLFTFLYYSRPADLIPGVSYIPLEKIVGGIALIALISTLASGRMNKNFPLELKLLVLLFVHLTIAIPFAYWRGGAFGVVFGAVIKAVAVGLMVTLIVDTLEQLRRLLWVQAASLVVTTIMSIAIHRTEGGRLIGALGGVFENPNDLAINIAINFPLCVAFALATRSKTKVALWSVGLLAMLLGVVLTYSRSGLLATVMAIVICLWEFGVRGRRFFLIAGAFVLSIVGVGVILGTPHYMTRVESIFLGNIEGSQDRGSWEARRELLVDSINEAVHHPVFGIGAGNFGAATKTWRVSHNTYTEFAAEGGFPALALYLAILYLAFRNLIRIRSMSSYAENPEIRLLSGALWGSLLAFAVGSFFASFEYQLFPYFMVAYTSVLYRVCVNLSVGNSPAETSLKRPVMQRVYLQRQSWKQ
jgi:O-antigen ligase